MLVLVTYDVNTETEAGKARLRKIAKQCVNYGQRVQNSVFECMLDPTQYRLLKGILSEIMSENDSIRLYNLGDKASARIETLGKSKSYNPVDDFLSI
ncbi:CRISPR-associated endonuclease Cas2 [Lachnobacterium bovis]|uniref:CRISPR-associated endoribonuclease Cas2 n=1 Tax=Lachnobacterium bovis DSM 14045 TaxID=1122142 RepID=A0A1H3MPK2_9FIRM|nr:CRISPR-associated endonuclease Cas2 [Lachnobacterium bovis]SDY78440.1 CRISPR-associated protein Cas2 [Lachnobacterium bovis DSM 14045]